ncbi:MAG TPA: hypothetical protein VMM15_27255 [Bradyrhizobium sp.]|nr:hypothetical protein [Bradyrhizobium sp.]
MMSDLERWRDAIADFLATSTCVAFAQLNASSFLRSVRRRLATWRRAGDFNLSASIASLRQAIDTGETVAMTCRSVGAVSPPGASELSIRSSP